MKKITVRAQLTMAFGGMVATLSLIAALAVHTVDEANERFRHFVTGVNALAHMEQSAGVAQVGETVQQMNSVTQKPPALAEQVGALVIGWQGDAVQWVKAVGHIRFGVVRGASWVSRRRS